MQQKTKRRIIIAVIILLIVCLIACLTLCDRDDNPKHKRAPSETIVGAEEETEKTEPAPEEDVKTDEEQPDHEQPAQETVAQSQTAKTPATGGSESNSESADKPGSGQASSTYGSSGSTTTDKPKEKVWVVDKQAWTEQVPEYGYGYQIYVDGSLVFETADPTAYEAKLDYYANQGTPTTQKMGQIVVGYKTINHPEEGHWEYR